MQKPDEKDVLILKRLVRNPKTTDSEIARSTGIPVNTVNRKRKLLEKAGIIRYYASIDQRQTGTGKFNTSQVYILKFKLGYMKQDIPAEMKKFDMSTKPAYMEHIAESYTAEIDGHAALIMVIEGKSDEDIEKFFNSIFVPDLLAYSGEPDAILQVTTFRLRNRASLFHNYLPMVNMEDGVIKEDWDDSLLFVD